MPSIRVLSSFLLSLNLVSAFILDREHKILARQPETPEIEETPPICESHDYVCFVEKTDCLRKSTESTEVTVFSTCSVTFESTDDFVAFFDGYSKFTNGVDVDPVLTELNVINATFKGDFKVDEVTSAFPSLVALRISGSNLPVISLPSSVADKLISLSVTQSNVTKTLLPETGTSTLKILDLSGNKITEIPHKIVQLYPKTYIDYRENPLECDSELFWILDPENTKYLTSLDQLKCGLSYNGKPAFQVVGFVREAQEGCPKGKNYECSCSVPYILPLQNGTFTPMVVVDCSKRGMTQFPETLPKHTTTLHLEHNKITSLDGEVDLVNFTSLVNLHMDNNSISKIDHLQGTWFGENFRLLSLKGNKFETIPTHVFRTILSRNVNVHSLYFGSDSWICNCQATPDFQIFLADYQKLIKDLEEIRCGSTASAKNRGKQIAHLSLETMCQTTDEVHMLDILNGVMSVLIVLIAVKLTYDWYKYRKTNQIPWIARRMP